MHRALIIMPFLLLVFSTSKAIEEPAHSVVQKDGNIEIRQYEPMLVARVKVNGSMREASNTGFRRLAKFIFGDNTLVEGSGIKTPVLREKSTKIKMTAPVTREQDGDDSWIITFVMPQKWTKETLPQPNNPDISIEERPGQLMAIIRFSGLANAKSHAKKQLVLETWLIDNDYVASGSPLYAGYDAPWVLPFLRRNEVMIPLEEVIRSPRIEHHK